MKKLSLLFAAGAFGGLIEVTWAWLCGVLHITSGLGVKLVMQLSPAAIYKPVVWGGIWAMAFLMPVLNKRPVLKGIVLSLLPTIATLFIFIPLRAKADSGTFINQNAMMGIYLGILTPVVVLVNNAIWGTATALWLKATDKN